MSTSGKPWLRIAAHYALFAAGCAVFAFVYAQFSHGVYSPFMSFMFAVPLLAGAGMALVARAVGLRQPPRAARQAWALAVVALTICSCLQGVFEIAGTASPLIGAYPIAAAASAGVAVYRMAAEA